MPLVGVLCMAGCVPGALMPRGAAWDKLWRIVCAKFTHSQHFSLCAADRQDARHGLTPPHCPGVKTLPVCTRFRHCALTSRRPVPEDQYGAPLLDGTAHRADPTRLSLEFSPRHKHHEPLRVRAGPRTARARGCLPSSAPGFRTATARC